MCGIAGICIPGSAAVVDAHILQEMTDAITHRGPDGHGYFIEGGTGLGHRRLSIIDLHKGDQPMFNGDSSIVIVYNGEIYNYKELRDELADMGRIFRTESDTEVIIQLYEEFGTDCLNRLNGMFAFAIWDKREQQLFIARDRLGEKPLYYSIRSDGEIYFASELKSLRGAIPDLELDLTALDSFLSYGYVPSPKSIYKTIRKLPAAHMLLWRRGEMAVSRYWGPPIVTGGSRSTDGEMLEELRELLIDSTRIRLRSDVPVGAFLSGGIDSSLVVALASQVTSSSLSTYSVGFDEDDYDESEFARLLARHYGTEHHEIRVKDFDMHMFPDLVSQFDEPFGDPSALPTYYVTEAASRHLKVCLSGDAGDELFGGYPQYQLEPGEAWLNSLPSFLRRLFFGVPAKLMPDSVRGKGWLRRMSAEGPVRYQRNIGIFDSIERAALLRPECQSAIDHDASYFQPWFPNGGGEIAARMSADQNTYLSEDILVKVDRNSMMNSLEVRVPFLDHRIVEFANRLPLDSKIRNGVQKWPLKEVLRPLAPPTIISRPKQGFSVPIRDWLRESYRDLAADLLLADGNRSHDYLDKATVRSLFAAHQSGQRDLSERLWCLMWFEQWCRTFSP